ncbi:MAG: 5-formyltetrahydrofolate cyclo-ligase [Thermodesulfobacteriota bacterium]
MSNRRIFLNSFDREQPVSNVSAFGVKDYKGIIEEKRKVRAALLAARSLLAPIQVNKKSKKISANLFTLERFIRANRVALYSPIKNEVKTESIFETARECGKEVYFPRVQNSILEFHKVDDLGELMPGKFGIAEPSPYSNKIRVKDLDMIIVPGVAFDTSGRRLGYGKGYYDRALIDVENEKVVGLAFSLQVLCRIPAEPGDRGVGILITENGIIFAQGGG